jgi:hypothetical protein
MVPPRVDENSARIAKQYAASFPLPPLVLAGRRYRSCAAAAGFSDVRVLRRGRPGVGKIQRVLVFHKQSDPRSEIRSSDYASTVVWYQKDPYSHISLPPTK